MDQQSTHKVASVISRVGSIYTASLPKKLQNVDLRGDLKADRDKLVQNVLAVTRFVADLYLFTPADDGEMFGDDHIQTDGQLRLVPLYLRVF